MPSYDVFVSNAAADLEWTNGVLGYALKQAGVRWISESQFAVGTNRAAAIAEAIAASRFLVIVLSPAYVADNWKQHELGLIDTASVEKRSTRVIPLIKDQVAIPPTLKRFTSIDFTQADKTPAALSKLFAALNGVTARRPSEKPPCPYPGLYAFDESKSEYFFGRQREIDKLVNLLRRHNFVAVTGASGSGKSSLVRAGLPPALRESSQFGNGEWNVLFMRPGEHPLERLRALFPKPLAEAPTNTLAVEPQNVLLIVDALEELLTLVRAEQEHRDFERAVLELLRLPYVYIAVTVRSDFFMGFGNSLLRDEMLGHELRLEPLDAEGLREAIREPARKVQVEIEATLVERLVNDSERDEGASILPLIQETLVRLWDTGLVGRYLPLSAYEKIPNGLHGVLSEHADQTYAELVTAEKKEYARRIFLQLIQVNAQPPDTRRSLALEKLSARFKNEKAFQETLEHLVRNRLLISDAASDVQNPHVDLAHERLIDKWERLKKWIEADRDGLRLAQTLTQDATEWERHKRASSFLYRGEQLREIAPWSQAHVDELSEMERRFLKASDDARRRQTFTIAGAAGMLLLVVLGLVVWMVSGLPPFDTKTRWKPVAQFQGKDVTVLERDRDGTLYLGMVGVPSEEDSLYRSTSEGESWEPLLNSAWVQDVLLDPLDKDVVYVAVQDHSLGRGNLKTGEWVGIDKQGIFKNVWSMAAAVDGRIYATDPDAGVYMSDNQGDSWEQVGNNQPKRVVWVDWLAGQLFAANEMHELWRLTARGDWELTNDEPLFVKSSDKFGDGWLWGGSEGIFRTDEHYKPTLLVPLDAVRSVAAADDNSGTWIAGTGDGQVYLGSGAVKNFQRIGDKPNFNNANSVHAVLWFPNSITRLWAATEQGLYQGERIEWYQALGQ